MGKIELMTITKHRRPKDLKEWVDYYLAIGFDYISIFDNNSLFSVTELFADYKNVYVKEVKEEYGITSYSNQLSLANSFFASEKNEGEVEWLGWFDDDEFLYIKDGGSISTVLDDIVCNSFFWKSMSLPKPIEYRKKTMIDTFNYTRNYFEPNYGVHMKHILNLRKYDTLYFGNTHAPITDGGRHSHVKGMGYVGASDFVAMRNISFYDNLACVLYHYYDQSVRDYKFKRTRGGDTKGYYVDVEEWKKRLIEKDYSVKDDSMRIRKKELGI